MQKVGGIWSPIIFCWNLLRGLADMESWRDLEPHNFLPDSFLGSWLMQKVGGIWDLINKIIKLLNKLSQILLCTIWTDKGLFDCRV